MPRAVPKKKLAVAPAAAPTIVFIEASPLRIAAGLWNKRLNIVSGGVVLAYGTKTVKKTDLRKWMIDLRLVADEMEKFL